MHSLKLFIASSIDGHIAREDGSIDWLFTDADYGYTPFINATRWLMMGRKTYDQLLTFGPWPYGDRPTLVLSRSRQGSDGPVTFLAEEEAVQRMQELRSNPAGGNGWVVGGTEVITLCFKHHLIDELILSVHPTILGRGIPLFGSGIPTSGWHLAEVASFPSGLAQLRYTRQ